MNCTIDICIDVFSIVVVLSGPEAPGKAGREVDGTGRFQVTRVTITVTAGNMEQLDSKAG